MHTQRVSSVVAHSLRAGAAAVFALLLLLIATGAHAHSVLLGSDPEDGAQLDIAPDEVSLTFNEDITDLGTEIVITTGDGTVINEGDTEIDGPTISQALSPERPEGLYTVTWRAVSADGHPISGEFTFTAATETSPDQDQPAEPETPEEEGGSGEAPEATQNVPEDADDDVTADEENPADDGADGTDVDSGSASTWVIIGVILVAAIILLMVLARAMAAKKNE